MSPDDAVAVVTALVLLWIPLFAVVGLSVSARTRAEMFDAEREDREREEARR